MRVVVALGVLVVSTGAALAAGGTLAGRDTGFNSRSVPGEHYITGSLPKSRPNPAAGYSSGACEMCSDPYTPGGGVMTDAGYGAASGPTNAGAGGISAHGSGGGGAGAGGSGAAHSGGNYGGGGDPAAAGAGRDPGGPPGSW